MKMIHSIRIMKLNAHFIAHCKYRIALFTSKINRTQFADETLGINLLHLLSIDMIQLLTFFVWALNIVTIKPLHMSRFYLTALWYAIQTIQVRQTYILWKHYNFMCVHHTHENFIIMPRVLIWHICKSFPNSFYSAGTKYIQNIQLWYKYFPSKCS